MDEAPRGRTVILVDDGLATGAAMRAAARLVRAPNPAPLLAAVPVRSREACAALAADTDELICPAMPEPFHAIGLHYVHFEHVVARRSWRCSGRDGVIPALDRA